MIGKRRTKCGAISCHKPKLSPVHQTGAGPIITLFGLDLQAAVWPLLAAGGLFEADPPFPEGDKRRCGYSRDRRQDCVQVIIALVVTPEGLPLAYDVLPGNTADNNTLRGFLDRIARQYGKAQRI